MAAKSRTPARPSHGIAAIWEKHGTWVVGLLAVALLIMLGMMMYSRHRETKRTEFLQRVATVNSRLTNAELQLRMRLQVYGLDSIEPIKPVAAATELELQQLLLDCEHDDIRARINLSLGQAQLKQEKFAEAETTLSALSGNEALEYLDRAHLNLGLAYAKQGLDKLAEARVLWEKVRDDDLYAIEALRNMALIDSVLARRKALEPDAPKTEAPKTETPEKTD